MQAKPARDPIAQIHQSRNLQGPIAAAMKAAAYRLAHTPKEKR